VELNNKTTNQKGGNVEITNDHELATSTILCSFVIPTPPLF